MALTRELHKRIKSMSRSEMEVYFKHFYDDAHNSGFQKGLSLSKEIFLKGIEITRGIGPVLSSRIISNVTKLTEKYTKRPEKLTLYWVSGIVQYHGDPKPSLLSISDSCLTLEEAMKEIDLMRGHPHYKTISAWIDVFDENNNKTVVYHESFINVFGDFK